MINLSNYLNRELVQKIKRNIADDLLSRYGVDPQRIHSHFNVLFSGTAYSWDNHGKEWEIDHLTPKSFYPYSSIAETNFSGCWAVENLGIKSVQENRAKATKTEGGLSEWFAKNKFGQALIRGELKDRSNDRLKLLRQVIGSVYWLGLSQNATKELIINHSANLDPSGSFGFNERVIANAIENIYKMNDEKKKINEIINIPFYNHKFKVKNGSSGWKNK